MVKNTRVARFAVPSENHAHRLQRPSEKKPEVKMQAHAQRKAGNRPHKLFY